MDKLASLIKMMESKNLHEEVEMLRKLATYCSGFSFAWISPSGELYELSYGTSHAEFATDYVKKNDIDYRTGMSFTPSDYLVEIGWARVSNAFDMQVLKLPLTNQANMHMAEIMGTCVAQGKEDIEVKTMYVIEGSGDNERSVAMPVVQFVEGYMQQEAQEKFYSKILD
jgi:hypothetical protein